MNVKNLSIGILLICFCLLSFEVVAKDSFTSLTELRGSNDPASISGSMNVNDIGLVLSDNLLTSMYTNNGANMAESRVYLPKKVPKEIDSKLRSWSWSARFLRATQVGLGISAIVLSLLATTEVNDSEENYLSKRKEWLMFGAGLSASLYSAFDLGNKSNNTRNAWRILNEAKIRYEEDENFDVNQLIDAYREGEKTIGGLQFKSSDGNNK